MKEIAAAIQPGTAALFVLVRKVTADKMLEGLKGEGGTVLKTSLDHTEEEALRAALAGAQAVVPTTSPMRRFIGEPFVVWRFPILASRRARLSRSSSC